MGNPTTEAIRAQEPPPRPVVSGILLEIRTATGRIETLGEERTIALLTRDLERDRLLRTLLVELLMSEGFRVAEEPTVEEGGE